MRIVSHTCSNTEIVCALGCADMLVGVDAHSDYPPDVVEKLPEVGADLDLNIDQIEALRPDLVLTSLTVPGHEKIVAELEARGIPHLVCDPTGLSDVAEDFIRIAEALGVETRGRQLAEHFIDTMQPYPETDRPPALLVEWWPRPSIVPGQLSWVTEMIALAGGINPWAADPVKSRPVTDEEVLAARPDAVIMSWCGVDESKYHERVVYRRQSWSQIPAFRHRQVYGISEALLGRPGPRLVQGLAALRSIVDRIAIPA